MYEHRGPDAMTLVELPDPEPGKGQVVIAVESAGVNFPDILMSRGLYQMSPPLPVAPGGEVAGTVVAVGPGVKNVAEGDRVMALTGFGGFATHIVLGADRCVPVPDAVDLEVAGAFAFTYATSYHALKDRAGLKKGDKLLVLGAAGGVGLSAVEIGAHLGAEVIAAASNAEKLALTKEYGASHGINYAEEDLKKRAKALGGGAVDVVYDPVGGDLSEPALRTLGYGGRHLVIGFAAGTIPKIPLNLPLLKQCAIVGVAWGSWAMAHPEQHKQNLWELLGLLAEGKLRPHISERYSLDEAVSALRDMEQRKVLGKVTIVP
ncbi:MAG: NADPH:quinone oxidoreductase family protein [Myxococcota bacterium]